MDILYCNRKFEVQPHTTVHYAHRNIDIQTTSVATVFNVDYGTCVVCACVYNPIRFLRCIMAIYSRRSVVRGMEAAKYSCVLYDDDHVGRWNFSILSSTFVHITVCILILYGQHTRGLWTLMLLLLFSRCPVTHTHGDYTCIRDGGLHISNGHYMEIFTNLLQMHERGWWVHVRPIEVPCVLKTTQVLCVNTTLRQGFGILGPHTHQHMNVCVCVWWVCIRRIYVNCQFYIDFYVSTLTMKWESQYSQ